jgi:hypothetical protein
MQRWIDWKWCKACKGHNPVIRVYGEWIMLSCGHFLKKEAQS